MGGSTIGAQVPVTDFAATFVDVFHPGIEVEKTADPIAAGRWRQGDLHLPRAQHR